ncbi:glycosyltransferase [Janibacter indicus]|uniref:Glycosyltransferase n=1 Tax=Janibacter indicus TaxID=857417 RepID=A0A1L3MJN7_9MICO|nr:VOC family protein [Janibacter indicus]APH02558.1 glycosyltransferase [Janibacter indicus]
MRVDHVSYAADQSGVKTTAERLGEALGVTPVDGGIHPRFGTRNMILPLAHERYVEIVEVLDHPSSDKAPFGQVVRARSEAGGGWMGWVIRVDEEIEAVEERLDRKAVEGNRRLSDGREFRWKQIGIKGTLADPQLPFFVKWGEGSPHPSEEASTEVTISSLMIAGDQARVTDWLGGLPPEETSSVITFDFVAPHGTPGLMSVTFNTPGGPVTL